MRRPTLKDFGLEVTLVAVAITKPNDHFVVVSDMMLSFDDVYQADDRAARKVMHVHDNWAVAFAGDAPTFKSVVRKIFGKIKAANGDDLTAELMRDIASEAFSEVQLEEFAARHLYQIGYRTVDDFKREGRQELGDRIFDQYMHDMAEFHIDVSMLVFGYDDREAHLFEVVAPGKVIDGNVLGYGVIGSGYSMAIGSLRRKRLTRDISETIYRLLEAKFSAETASGVGRTTILMVMNADGDTDQLEIREIDQIRKAWEATLAQPEPKDAMDAIDKSHAVTKICGGAI
jgi:20S proteasome alpha/beta subunit